MPTEIGEYLVGAYLKLIIGCDFVDYNVRVQGGGLAGLNELDVIGIQFEENTAYLCEVTTHLRGTLYRNNEETVKRVIGKYERQKAYADTHLSQFDKHIFMFWSPYVPKGYITSKLENVDGLELIINGEYTRRVQKLRDKAQNEKQDTGNLSLGCCRYWVRFGNSLCLKARTFEIVSR